MRYISADDDNGQYVLYTVSYPPPPALPGYYRQQGTASGRVTSRVRL